ncbi:type II secretion system protein [Lactiplantibacillus herbarum]|uniref:type II secretion system protein n=1 Tax=Lactiplantibacillus herbarum TaxID=1670446 RepID=UPI00064FC2FF|nr:type II secretion system protein [Lactiplantibacillus herbarum]
MLVRRAGFTLIETVTVLAITASLLLITVHRFPTRQRQRNDEIAFWQQLQTLWQRQTLTASVTGQPQVVSFRGTEVVTWAGKRGQPAPSQQWHLRLPKTLVTQRGRDVQIQKNGHPELAVIIFKSQLQPKQPIKMNVLMGWGAYRIDNPKKASGFYDG